MWSATWAAEVGLEMGDLNWKCQAGSIGQL